MTVRSGSALIYSSAKNGALQPSQSFNSVLYCACPAYMIWLVLQKKKKKVLHKTPVPLKILFLLKLQFWHKVFKDTHQRMYFSCPFKLAISFPHHIYFNLIEVGTGRLIVPSHFCPPFLHPFLTQPLPSQTPSCRTLSPGAGGRGISWL